MLVTYLNARILARNRRLNKRRMTQNQKRTASHQPKHKPKRTREPQQRNPNHKQARVQALLSNHVFSHLHRLRSEAVDGHKSDHEENDGEEEEEVVDHAVDGEKDENDGVVAGKVARVVGDALESFVGVLWARDALVVEEFGERAETGESFRAERADPLRDCKGGEMRGVVMVRLAFSKVRRVEERAY